MHIVSRNAAWDHKQSESIKILLCNSLLAHYRILNRVSIKSNEYSCLKKWHYKLYYEKEESNQNQNPSQNCQQIAIITNTSILEYYMTLLHLINNLL